ncbi:MAG: hypothetical protein JXR76_11490 [Deltaproteobacteria bacterium]|nr:hypothetical protein [Deltaproteobacteria bacterium]
MKRLQLGILGAGITLLMAQGALGCYLSSACDSGEICINQECAAPNVALESCTSTSDCDYSEACMEGKCKPNGIYCTSDTGWAIMGPYSGSLTCNASGWESGGDGEAERVDMPDIDDLSEDELALLAEECVSSLVEECDDEIPVPADECSPEALKQCTDWVLFMDVVDQVCEDQWNNGVIGQEPSEGTATGESKPDSNSGTSDGEESNGSNMSKARLISARGLSAEANPFAVVDCCKDLAEMDNEEVAAVEQMFACMADLSPSDCDKIMACEEALYDVLDDEYAGDDSGVARDNNGMKSDKQAGNSDDDAEESGSAADGSSDSSNTSDSGCSIATPGRPGQSILSLLF